MIRRAISSLVLLTLAACMVLPYVDAPPASEFAPLALPRQSFATPEDVIAHFVPPQVLAGPGVTSEIGRDPYRLASRLILVTATGYEDDSLRGEQWRIALVQSETSWRVVEAGVRYNCARGESPGWSNQLCP